MSYVQGTRIKVTGTFQDPDTRELTDPTDVEVVIKSPDGVIETRTFSANEVTKVPGQPKGVYMTVIDTSAAAGEWTYQFGSIGPDAVKKLRTLRVRPGLS